MVALNSKWGCTPFSGKPESYGYYLTLDKAYSAANLDLLLFNISFVIQTASGTLNMLPSSYLNLCGYDTSKSIYYYCVNVARTDTRFGLLGNAWMNKWLIQQNPTTLQLKLTRVKSCSDVAYLPPPPPPPPTPPPPPLSTQQLRTMREW